MNFYIYSISFDDFDFFHFGRSEGSIFRRGGLKIAYHNYNGNKLIILTEFTHVSDVWFFLIIKFSLLLIEYFD